MYQLGMMQNTCMHMQYDTAQTTIMDKNSLNHFNMYHFCGIHFLRLQYITHAHTAAAMIREFHWQCTKTLYYYKQISKFTLNGLYYKQHTTSSMGRQQRTEQLALYIRLCNGHVTTQTSNHLRSLRWSSPSMSNLTEKMNHVRTYSPTLALTFSSQSYQIQACSSSAEALNC